MTIDLLCPNSLFFWRRFNYQYSIDNRHPKINFSNYNTMLHLRDYSRESYGSRVTRKHMYFRLSSSQCLPRFILYNNCKMFDSKNALKKPFIYRKFNCIQENKFKQAWPLVYYHRGVPWATQEETSNKQEKTIKANMLP